MQCVRYPCDVRDTNKFIDISQTKQQNRRGNRRQKEPRHDLELKPSYKGQPVLSVKVKRDPFICTIAATTGLNASTVAMSAGTISNFATRFAAWQEYRIVKATIKFRPFSSVQPGLLRMWVEEKSGSVPTSTDAVAAIGMDIPLSGNNREFSMVWKPADFAEENWNALSTSITSSYVNLYTDNATFGSGTTAANVGFLDIEYTIQFRGFA